MPERILSFTRRRSVTDGEADRGIEQENADTTEFNLRFNLQFQVVAVLFLLLLMSAASRTTTRPRRAPNSCAIHPRVPPAGGRCGTGLIRDGACRGGKARLPEEMRPRCKMHPHDSEAVLPVRRDRSPGPRIPLPRTTA